MPGESMRQKARKLVGLLAGVIFIITLLGSSVLTEARPVLAQAASVTVAITAPDTVMPGSDFTANVTITQVQNFDACNYDVSFNSTVLRLNNVTSGKIGGTVIPVDIWSENATGRYRVVQNVSGLSGVSGSGYLAVLHFKVLGSAGQSSVVNLSSGRLGNTLAEAIPATWAGDLVSVISGESGGQGSPSAPTLLPETTSNASETTTTESEAATTEPEATATEPEVEAEKAKEEGLPTLTLASVLESETTAAVETAPASPSSSPPAAKVGHVDWPVLGGAIGGGIIVIGLIIFFLVVRL